MEGEIKKLKFRNLIASEIELRIQRVTENGVSLLAYKDARCDQNILDETVGPLNWQRHHSRDNANCIVSIWDEEKNQWIEKEDTGKESFSEAEKGLASDSFKRSCFLWGIGRALYTAPILFIFPNKLTKLKKGENGKWVCNNSFKCLDIKYSEDEKSIAQMTVGIYEYEKLIGQVVFGKATTTTPATAHTNAPVAKATQSAPAPVPAQKIATPTPKSNSSIGEDEVILMGNCRGKKYGEVKNTAQFISFLKWAAGSTTKYADEKTSAQFLKFKEMGSKLATA